MQNAETKLQNLCRLAVGMMPDVLVLRLQSGVFRALHDPKRIVRVGTPGLPDTMMLVATTVTPDMVGQRVCLAVAAEIKTPTGTQSQEQSNWQRAFEKRGGIYRIIRSPEAMLALAQSVIQGQFK